MKPKLINWAGLFLPWGFSAGLGGVGSLVEKVELMAVAEGKWLGSEEVMDSEGVGCQAWRIGEEEEQQQ